MDDKEYLFFWHGPLSQWVKSYFKEEKIEYCCAEQYMMAQKALMFKDPESFDKIMNSSNPKDHQKFGREVKNFDQKRWDSIKEEIVYRGNWLKFTQNKGFRDTLLKTKKYILVEASPFDKVWGIGMGVEDEGIEDSANWKGQNLLGKTITRVRDDILKDRKRKREQAKKQKEM